MSVTDQEHATRIRPADFGRPSTVRTVDGWQPVEPHLLQTDTVLEFDLYIWPSSSTLPVLFRNRNMPFLREHRDRLATLDNRRFYIRTEDEASVICYVERNLEKILSDPQLDLHEKAGALYTTSMQLVQEILERPEAAENLRRTEVVVRSTVGYILQGKEAFHQLLSLTSFDYYTYTHSVNVCTMGLALAAEAGYTSEEDLTAYGKGALLHDIGKMKVDPDILRKRGPLTDTEWNEMKRHPELGLTVGTVERDFAEPSKAVIAEHHEWVDGSGYPAGKKGDDIHPFARITTIVDVFDALTSRRAYKSAVGSFSALKVMRTELDTHFQQDYFQKFVVLLGK
jgi:putative nucleotidyltransferase with HDIG domain